VSVAAAAVGALPIAIAATVAYTWVMFRTFRAIG
jgi:hypothetical protein